jgi:ribosomal protein S12 methylthiotransferase accessory factor
MFYRLRPTVDVIQLGEDRLLLRSDTLSIKIEGGFCKLLQRLILPALDGRLALAELAQRLEVSPALLRDNFENLADSGIFERSLQPFEKAAPTARFNLLRAMGLADSEVERRFREARIAVFGMERPGALTAEALLAAGFRNLTLVDPSPAQGEDFLPDELEQAVSREQLVSERLKSRYPGSLLPISSRPNLSREGILELARGFDLLVAGWDQGFISGNHWVNRAAHAVGVPALFCEIKGMQVLAGPFVVPGLTACFMCARMRSVATAEDFEAAMAGEEYYDQFKSPDHSRREILSPACATVASLLASEALRYLILGQQPVLAGDIVEYDPFTLTLRHHALLEHPNCPVCSEKKKPRVTTQGCNN